MSLDRKEFFVSPFDLNVEYGKIKEPKKPMVRFATPVFKNSHALPGTTKHGTLANRKMKSYKLYD